MWHCDVGIMHIILLLIISCVHGSVAEDENVLDYGAGLISSLRNDANLDLPVDEEYEDLRAQLLAYHSALASLKPSRRSMLTTQCWRRGGICINYKLCPGYRQLTEIPGCKNRHNVCCFVWNQYEIREHKEQGINNLAFPWKIHSEFGGQGVQQVTRTRKPRKKKTTKDPEQEMVVFRKRGEKKKIKSEDNSIESPVVERRYEPW